LFYILVKLCLGNFEEKNSSGFLLSKKLRN